MKKYIILLCFTLLIVSGCSSLPKFTQDMPIQRTTIKNLSELADDFASKTYNNFYQFEINYLDYEVNELRLNYYKNGEIKKELLLFNRENQDEKVPIPNMQYIYLGYQFKDLERRDIDVSMYLYGPKQENKYEDDYSASAQPQTLTVEYNRLLQIKPIEKIFKKNNKFYIYPIVLNAKHYHNVNDMTMYDLINDHFEFLVLEMR